VWQAVQLFCTIVFHVGVFRRRIGKRPPAPCRPAAGATKSPQRLEREVLPPGGGKVDIAAAGVEGDRLRPYLVFAGGGGGK